MLCLGGKGHKGPGRETGKVFAKCSKVTVFCLNNSGEICFIFQRLLKKSDKKEGGLEGCVREAEAGRISTEGRGEQAKSSSSTGRSHNGPHWHLGNLWRPQPGAVGTRWVEERSECEANTVNVDECSARGVVPSEKRGPSQGRRVRPRTFWRGRGSFVLCFERKMRVFF